ncbi:MAG: glucuronate isomerase [Clostridia bacterium]|nr:glucuronate isomerase [Clostridia bacterium]
MRFFDENVFLNNPTAVRLYEGVKKLPILDYHCHMTAKAIFEDRKFTNIGQIWLESDHYKWRAMRQCGIEEKYITGDASWKEKYLAYARVMPLLAGSPLYHWTHMELLKVFKIGLPLNEDTAAEIWNQANEQIMERKLSPQKMLDLFHVEVLCTTDDPEDDLFYHGMLKGKLNTRILPAFRPDLLVSKIGDKEFPAYCERNDIHTFDDLMDFLDSRLDAFIAAGCRVADHGMTCLPKTYGSHTDASNTFSRRMAGSSLSDQEIERYADCMLRHMMSKYAEKNIAVQLHIGPMRNVNTNAFPLYGPDSGFDTAGDFVDPKVLLRILNSVNSRGDGLPKMIFYCLNDTQDAIIASVIGAFADTTPGKMQLGAAWWFNDHRDGIEKQLKTYANALPIGNFIGMLTDSRSFTSYSRFDYFRRILCNLLGQWVENGELHSKAAELVAEKICYSNAKTYFGF